MSDMDIILETLKLRNQPFLPSSDADGKPIDQRLLIRALDPVQDPRLLSLYFDFYDWSGSPSLGGISRSKALERFPDDIDLDGALLVLVSGTSQTGRDSLVNLVLYALEKRTAGKPLVVSADLDGLGSAQHIKDLARLFLAALEDEPGFDAEDLGKLQAIYDKEVREVRIATGSDTYYSVLFQRLASKVRARLKRPIVFAVKGDQRYDFWSCLYKSTHRLVDLIIIQTQRFAAARTCQDQLHKDGKTVAHIHAPQLNLEMARLYVQDRLASERPKDIPVAPIDVLIPFTFEALQILFEPGSDGGKRLPEHPIGWLRRTFLRALQDHIDGLAKVLVEKGPKSLSALSVQELLVSKATMWNARQSLNFNKE